MGNKEINTKKSHILNIAIMILSIVYFFGVLSSHLYLIKEMDHECSGENCLICETISVAKRIVEGLDVVGPVILIAVFLYFIFIKKILLVSKNIKVKSPVELKVKLRN